jgi:hypothetical protein
MVVVAVVVNHQKKLVHWPWIMTIRFVITHKVSVVPHVDVVFFA